MPLTLKIISLNDSFSEDTLFAQTTPMSSKQNIIGMLKIWGLEEWLLHRSCQKQLKIYYQMLQKMGRLPIISAS